MATYRDYSKRPTAITPDLTAIPGAVKRYPQWVLWQYVWKEESTQWAKIPINPHDFKFAKSDDPSTWATFEKVSELYRNEPSSFDGVGFVFSVDDPYCGIDFDNCVNTDGTISPMVQGQIDRLDSYTEYSASETGVHVIVTGAYGGGNKKGDREVYDRKRYFAFTGKQIGTQSKIHWRQNALEKLKLELSPSVTRSEIQIKPIRLGKSAAELMNLAFASRKGERIKKLYEGDTSDYGGDDSSADLGLCGHLAFWCGGDFSLLDEMFRGSRLYREKWDKRHSSDGRTYGQMTIERALEGKTEFYSGKNQTVIEPPLVGIYHPHDLKDELFELYRTGRQSGESPGWANLAELYTVKKRQFTVLTGIPGSGKSAVLDALLVNMANGHGWKFAVCSLETQPIEMHMSMIAEIYTGEPFNTGPTPRMSVSTLETGLDWIDRHFTFVLPDEKDRTLEGVIALVSELDVDGVVIDPWNELEHRRPQNMSETEYVSHALSKMRHHARLFNQHWWLVAHPTKLPKDKNTGHYLVPTLYDISGSAHFRNKADFGIAVHRNAEDPSGPSSVYVQKVRFRWCGKIGSCDLYFDRLTGRYSETPNVYGSPKREWAGSSYE